MIDRIYYILIFVFHAGKRSYFVHISVSGPIGPWEWIDSLADQLDLSFLTHARDDISYDDIDDEVSSKF